ncbi:MAG: S8 family peptidase [candidate division Zixibacteria bacterium]|nr:S8 family peptidase [candidate division Zixibacteria bacterium]
MRFRYRQAIIGVLTLVLASGPGSLLCAGIPSQGAVPGRFVVKLSGRVSATAISQSLADNQRLEPIVPEGSGRDLIGVEQWERVYCLRTTDETLTAERIRLQLGPANVEYVEPEYYIDFYAFPSDSLFADQWYLYNTGQHYLAVDRIEGEFNDTLALRQGTAGRDIGLRNLYQSPPDITAKIVVAVVDTGVDPTHPELQGRFWQNSDEIPDNGLDDDHNGYVDDIIGYDISGDTIAIGDVIGDNDPSDDFGHGTHIAGIIAATSNSHGVAGIAPSSEIMAVKIRPNGTTVVGAKGIVYAVNSGANIINVSWGTPFESLLLQDAVEYAHANGVLVCVSAGNSGDFRYLYPAAIPESFTVAAGDSRGFVAGFSTYGPHIDLCAPGENILSLRAAGTDMYAEAHEPRVHIVGDDSLYYLADGTSMAAPMVAGAAALIWSVRPELTLEQIEADLTSGARDMIDPFGIGDSLPGFDSLSGFGYLDVGRSLSIARQGGLFFVSPAPRTRHVGQVELRAASAEGYSGGWELYAAASTNPNDWQLLTFGSAPPPDSVLYVLDDPQFEGQVTLKLLDDFGTPRLLTVTLVMESRLELTSPVAGAEYDYNIPVSGRAFGPDFESLSVYYRRTGGPREFLFETGGEYFDSLIYSWNASGITLGEYTIYLEGHFQSGLRSDSVTFLLTSAFAEGWPQNLSGRGALTAVADDLDHDGTKELIVGTTYGLNVFHSDGRPMEGFPVLFGSSARCIPAIYDVNHDGYDEIICTSDSGLNVFNHDGSYADSLWPVYREFISWGYGVSNPTVTLLGIARDSAIVVFDGLGNVLAYTFEGVPYHASREGWFASFQNQPQASAFFNGNGLSGADLDGDGYNELVASYYGVTHAGVAVFEGRSGRPAFGRPLPYVIEGAGVNGTVLADLNSDTLPEIVMSGFDSAGVTTLWARSHGTEEVPGWPKRLPEIKDWMGSYPMAADLDLDGTPEILATFYELDIGVLYIFRADGTPYRTIEGRPAGEAYRYPATFGAPVVANLVGDSYPEIVIRSGHIFPGGGREEVHILDHLGVPLAGWPIQTPTDPSQVFSTPYAPLVDDVDGDGLVELVLVGEGLNMFAWDFEASYENGKNCGRILMDNQNSSIYHGSGPVTDVPTEPAGTLPRRFQLHQNYPNPFNPTTAISFELPVAENTRLEVFNVLGQRVAVLADQWLPAGSHTIGFDGSDLASGVYLYRLKTDTHEDTRKMVMVK